jgi:hypothetical protein
MPYYVMCRVSDGVTGTRESILARHGVPVVFRTFAEAEATAEDLRHERQPTRGTVDYHYWVVECAFGNDAGGETHASLH